MCAGELALLQQGQPCLGAEPSSTALLHGGVRLGGVLSDQGGRIPAAPGGLEVHLRTQEKDRQLRSLDSAWPPEDRKPGGGRGP